MPRPVKFTAVFADPPHAFKVARLGAMQQWEMDFIKRVETKYELEGDEMTMDAMFITIFSRLASAGDTALQGGGDAQR